MDQFAIIFNQTLKLNVNITKNFSNSLWITIFINYVILRRSSKILESSFLKNGSSNDKIRTIIKKKNISTKLLITYFRGKFKQAAYFKISHADKFFILKVWLTDGYFFHKRSSTSIQKIFLGSFTFIF